MSRNNANVVSIAKLLPASDRRGACPTPTLSRPPSRGEVRTRESRLSLNRGVVGVRPHTFSGGGQTPLSQASFRLLEHVFEELQHHGVFAPAEHVHGLLATLQRLVAFDDLHELLVGALVLVVADGVED